MFQIYLDSPPLPPACVVSVLGCHGRATKFLCPTRALAPARGIDGADDDGRAALYRMVQGTAGGSSSGAHRQHQTDRDNRTGHHDPIHTLILPWCTPVRLPVRRAGFVSGLDRSRVTRHADPLLGNLIRVRPGVADDVQSVVDIPKDEQPVVRVDVT